MPSLFVFQGVDQGARFELRAETITVGREATSAIQLHDTEVSRKHAELRRQGNRYVLVDLGSSNGTYVNGESVKVRELAIGDEIQLGSTLMLFTTSEDEPPRESGGEIDIVSPAVQDRSRIVRALRQDEGSHVLYNDASGSRSSWTNRAASNLRIMYRTAMAVSHTLDIDELLHRLMQLIVEWVEADRGCIMLLNPETGAVEPRVRFNRRGVKRDDKLTISQTILDYVLEHNEGVLTSDASEDNRWTPAASIVQQGIREAICVPMQGRYNVVGVIYIDTSTSPQQAILHGHTPRFTEDHLKLMIAIAHQAALAIEDTRYYSAMVQAERLAAVGQAIAMLSHHIKNILQGIRGGSFLIKDGLAQHNEELVRKGWEFVEKNQERISNLVLDMLTFSKEREPDLVAADLNEVAREVVELMAPHAAEHRVELVFHPAADLPRLTFDPEGLHRAILNVVTNAIDACAQLDQQDAGTLEADTRHGRQHLLTAQAAPTTDITTKPPIPSTCSTPAETPTISTAPTVPKTSNWRGRVEVLVEYQSEPSLARVIVCDNGPGIAPEDREQIFSLFVSRKGHRGTGLGLPVSQKIMKEHGGRIMVESELGHGSRFVLELPALPVPQRSGAPMPGASA